MLAGVILVAMGSLRLGAPDPLHSGLDRHRLHQRHRRPHRALAGQGPPRAAPRTLPDEFFAQLRTRIAPHLREPDPPLVLGVVSLAGLLLWPKSARSTPSSPARRLARRQLAALPSDRVALGHAVGGAIPVRIAALVRSVARQRCSTLPVDTIGTRFGGIPPGCRHSRSPHFDWATVQHLIAPTITIAMLGAIESLLCARVADGMIGDRATIRTRS